MNTYSKSWGLRRELGKSSNEALFCALRVRLKRGCCLNELRPRPFIGKQTLKARLVKSLVVWVNILAHHWPQFHEQPIAARRLSSISKDSCLPVVRGGSLVLQLGLFCLTVLFEDACHLGIRGQLLLVSNIASLTTLRVQLD